MLAVATSVDTFERLFSPVETSVVPTTSFGFEPPAAACTSKSVSGRMRYIVPSFQRTSAVPFGPVLMKSPSWSGMLCRSVSHVVRLARWIWTVPATSATCASLLMTAPAMIFSAVDFTSSAVRVARSFWPAARSCRASRELLVGRGDLALEERRVLLLLGAGERVGGVGDLLRGAARGVVLLHEEEDAARHETRDDEEADDDPDERLRRDVVPLELRLEVPALLLVHHGAFVFRKPF